MRAREVYEELHRLVDPKLLKVLVALAERQSVQQQEIDALGGAHDRSMRMVESMITVGSSMTREIDKLRGGDHNNDPVTGVKLQGNG